MRHRVIFSMLLAALASGCMTMPQGVAPVVATQGQSGQPVYYKPLTSWKERKFTDMVRQQTDFSCGAAALATIFNYASGKKTSEQQILVNMLKIADPDLIREKGFSLLDMKNYVAAVGMTGQGYEVEYDALKQLKVPAIALLDIRNYKHFVVIRKVDDNFVHVADPALGNRVMQRGSFEQSWNKVVFVIVGEGFDENSVLMNPPQPLSAARLYGLRSHLLNAEAYDFGLGPAYGFVF
jgi:predicted double-glycine peptidase